MCASGWPMMRMPDGWSSTRMEGGRVVAIPVSGAGGPSSRPGVSSWSRFGAEVRRRLLDETPAEDGGSLTDGRTADEALLETEDPRLTKASRLPTALADGESRGSTDMGAGEDGASRAEGRGEGGGARLATITQSSSNVAPASAAAAPIGEMRRQRGKRHRLGHGAALSPPPSAAARSASSLRARASSRSPEVDASIFRGRLAEWNDRETSPVRQAMTR